MHQNETVKDREEGFPRIAATIALESCLKISSQNIHLTHQSFRSISYDLAPFIHKHTDDIN